MYEQMSNKELLARIVDGVVAEQLVSRFASLNEITQASHEELEAAGLRSRAQIKRLRDVLALSQQGNLSFPKFKEIRNATQCHQLLAPEMANLEYEVFKIILLNKNHQLISVDLVSRGHLNGSLVHPRESFKPAIRVNASKIIISHNHPSGDSTPSSDDQSITKRLVECGKLLGIEVIDHVIIGDGYFSFLENGIM